MRHIAECLRPYHAEISDASIIEACEAAVKNVPNHVHSKAKHDGLSSLIARLTLTVSLLGRVCQSTKVDLLPIRHIAEHVCYGKLNEQSH